LGIRAVKVWPAWREPYRVLAALALVEAVAIAAPIVTWSPVSKGDLDLALLLASLSVTYCLFVIGWEKARRLLLFERAPAMTPDVLATWCFAAAILLPPTLAAAVTAISAIADWPSHPPGTRRLHRYVYSVLASVLAATIASWICRHSSSPLEGVSAAAAAWFAVGAGATTLAMCVSGQFGAAKTMLHASTHRLELVTMGVAVGEYAIYRAGFPLLLWLSLPVAVGIQRCFTRAELHSREVDARPIDGYAWQHIANVVVDAAETVSILRLDAADEQTARTVAMMQGGCDAIGSYPDGGLVILLLDCPPAQGDALARRLRIAMKLHKVECNIASASKPRDGQTSDDLLAVCEAELVVSRESARRPAEST
jgi:hypothetical protein